MSLKVRYDYPVSWGSSLQGLLSNYIQQTPDSQGIWDDAVFEINTYPNTCDFWVVHGDLDRASICDVRFATVFILSEEVEQRVWGETFLAQFDYVLGSQEHVRHPSFQRFHTVSPWQVNKTYTELLNIPPLNKSKNLSAIVSDITWKEGHKQRFAFVNQLKGHFKGRLDWYGRGNIFVADKWDALAAYKYSIAIENAAHDYYFTEKIIDCFLAYTIPFYFGCPNIRNYFPEEALILLNPNSLEESVAIIEEAIAGNHYERHFSALVEARNLALNKYQFFPAVRTKLLELDGHSPQERRITLKPESHFTRGNIGKRIIRKLIHYIHE